MTKDTALRLALEALENSVDLVRENAYSAEQLYGNYPARQGKVRGLKALVENHEKAITAIKAALEAKDEKDGSPCPEFWDWLPKTYRDGDIGDEPRFTKYNMEVAFLAGNQLFEQQPENEPVAWIIWTFGPVRAFLKKDEAMVEYERLNIQYPEPARKLLSLYTTPPQRKPLTDEEISSIDWKSNETLHDFARAIEAAHGIKGEA